MLPCSGLLHKGFPYPYPYPFPYDNKAVKTTFLFLGTNCLLDKIRCDSMGNTLLSVECVCQNPVFGLMSFIQSKRKRKKKT